MKETTAIKISAIVSIAVLEGMALVTHTDGAFFGPAVAIIGGIAGYELRGMKDSGKPATQGG